MNKKNIFLMIGSIAIALLFAYFVIKVAGSSLKVYNDKENYLDYLRELENSNDVHSGLFIFPNNVNYDDILGFKYFTQDGIFDGSYLFYLEVKYNNDDLLKEEERLKNLKVSFKEKEKKILYEPKGFMYPAYVSIADGFSTYEYALIGKKNNKIVYIFDQFFFFDELGLDEEYNPYDYVVSIDKRDYKSFGYNMYYLYDKYGNSRMYKEK